MRISDLKEENVKVGMKIRSLTEPTRIGTIVEIDYMDDRCAWVEWSNGRQSAFYGNWCECEVVED